MEKKGIHASEKDGKEIRLYHLTDGTISADILNVGGAIVNLMVPDKNGVCVDIMLGFKTLEEYNTNRCSFGCLVGRYANRIGNATFTLNGEKYDLVPNNGTANLHGGPDSWNKQVWDVVEEETDDKHLTMTYFSPDGDNFFPGNVKVKMIYAITENHGLSLEYFAETDKDTYVNITNHSYFNLKGHDQGDVLDHLMQIDAECYLPADAAQVPTGEIRKVEGTAFDFRTPKPIGQDIHADDPQLCVGGYDHNYCLDVDGLTKVATVKDPVGGRIMTVYTSKPGVQFYTANGLSASFEGKDGAVYPKHGGYCLETQLWPDTPNHPEFPGGALKVGETYHYVTVYEFSAE